MAKEPLYVPEEYLRETIAVIRAGLRCLGDVKSDVKEPLLAWCREEEEYLNRAAEDEEPELQ